MKITHLQSSTQIIQLGDTKLLTDPWLTDGEYYGSWYHYPPFPTDDLGSLEYDYIYVSHIHPDHISENTFKRLPRKAPVLIHNYASKFLKRKIEMLGFEAIECDHGEPFRFPNGGAITIYAADNCNPALCSKFLGCGSVEKKFGSTQIDSLAVFEHNGSCIINTNDCPFELAEKTIIANGLHKKDIDVLLVGYGGAGPYPQCFHFDREEDKRAAADAKQKQFLAQATKYIELLKPKCFVPFAGTYVLGSRLAPLSEQRGVPSLPDAVDYLNGLYSGRYSGVLLEQYDVLDAATGWKTPGNRACRLSYEAYMEQIAKEKLSYDDDVWDDETLPELINAAYSRFKAKAEEIGFNSATKVVIDSGKVAFRMGIADAPQILAPNAQVSEPFVRIKLDNNLLHRLLRGPRYAHWNNAEIGSHLYYERRPNAFERGLYHCLCYFHQ